jgi:hypothetical protein
MGLFIFLVFILSLMIIVGYFEEKNEDDKIY